MSDEEYDSIYYPRYLHEAEMEAFREMAERDERRRKAYEARVQR